MTEKNHGNGRAPHPEAPMSAEEIYHRQSLWVLAALLEGLRACAAADYLPQCQVDIQGPAQGVGAIVTFRMDWLLTADSLKEVETLVAAVLPGAGPVPQ